MNNKQSDKINRILKLFHNIKWGISERPALPEYLELHLEFSEKVKIKLKIDQRGEVIGHD